MSYNESLSAHSNYPPMSQWEWDHAPWNQEEPEPREVEVTVSVNDRSRHIALHALYIHGDGLLCMDAHNHL